MSPRPPSGPLAIAHHAIDPNVLSELRHIGGEAQPTFVARLVSRFVEQSRAGLEQLKVAQHQADVDSMRLVTHRMKGSARQVGATGLAQALEELLRAAEGRDATRIETQLRRVEDHWNRTLRELLAADLWLN